MFEGFDRRRIDAGEVAINAVIGGSGPPLLLLHGYPQTHVMWRKVAPSLARRFTVVATDLRGYGDSDKPAGDERHERYSKRCMAQDQVAVMEHLGFRRFHVAGQASFKLPWSLFHRTPLIDQALPGRLIMYSFLVLAGC